MSGRAYTIFDTAIGRCGIAWGHDGIVAVQLRDDVYPEPRAFRPERFLDGERDPYAHRACDPVCRRVGRRALRRPVPAQISAR